MERTTRENEETISHFSHKHPLELSNFQAQNTLKIQSTNCSACKLEPSDLIYSCAPCNFFLHAKCSKISKYLTHPYHEEHVLSLLSKPPNGSKSFTCDACRKSGDGFLYNCEHCNCNLHVLCAVLPMTQFHSAHPDKLKLTFDIPNSHIYLHCDICQETSYNQWFYWCSSCDFCVHLGCVNRSPVTKPTSSKQASKPQSGPASSRPVNPGLQVNHPQNQGRKTQTFMNPGGQLNRPWNQGQQTVPSVATQPLNPGLMYPPRYPSTQTLHFMPYTAQDHQRMVLRQAIQQLRGANAIQNRVAINMLESMVEGLGSGIGNGAVQNIMQNSGGVLGQNTLSGLFGAGDLSIPGSDGFGGLEGFLGGLFS